MSEPHIQQFGILHARVERSPDHPFTILTTGFDDRLIAIHMLSHEAVALGEAIIRYAREGFDD